MRTGELHRDSDAERLWAELYPALTHDDYGTVAALTARGPAYVVRLSCLFALLDDCTTVREEHLRAAVAVWRFCEQSAASLFHHQPSLRMNKPEPVLHVMDVIFEALTKAGATGLQRTEISQLFSFNISSESIQQALSRLEHFGVARMKHGASGPRGGRPAEWWFATRQIEQDAAA